MAEKYQTEAQGSHTQVREAARHQLWQCEATRRYGSQTAKELGDAHEADDPGTTDSAHDQKNNAVGRAAGEDLSGSCAALVEENIQNNNYALDEGIK